MDNRGAMLRRNIPGKDGIKTATIDHIATDRLRFDDETFANDDALANTLAPILRILKLTGSYVQVCNDNSNSSHLIGSEEHNGNKGSKFASKYTVVYTICVWMNAVRLLTAFTAQDKFGGLLINKLVMVSTYLQSAVVLTSCVFASWTGRLDQFLRLLRVTTDFLGVVRRLTIARIVFFEFSCIVYIVLFVYTIYFTQGSYDFLMAPFVTIIPVTGLWYHVAKTACVIMNFMSLLAWLWPRVLNQILTEILLRQFQIINKRFHEAITRRGHFKDSVKKFRHRHLAIAEAVRTVDRFSMMMNAASFGGHTFIMILLLYAFIFTTYSNPAVFGISMFMLAASSVSVTANSIHGTLVNNSLLLKFLAQTREDGCSLLNVFVYEAHELSSTIHDLDLATLDEEETRELLMFERRLSGESVGFSVFGLFVIDRTTAPKLLGILLTYFLFVVQMSSSVPSRDSFDCNDNVTSSTTTDMLMFATNNAEEFCKFAFSTDVCERYHHLNR